MGVGIGDSHILAVTSPITGEGGGLLKWGSPYATGGGYLHGTLVPESAARGLG